MRLCEPQGSRPSDATDRKAASAFNVARRGDLSRWCPLAPTGGPSPGGRAHPAAEYPDGVTSLDLRRLDHLSRRPEDTGAATATRQRNPSADCAQLLPRAYLPTEAELERHALARRGLWVRGALTWADIDFEGHTVTVRRTLQRYERAHHLDEPKTQRSRRTLHVPPPVESALLGHRVRQMEEQLRLGSTSANSRDLVFTDSFGPPRSGIQLTQNYQALLEGARLSREGFHDLRHAATFMLTEGVSLRTAMEVLGHSQIHVTANTYSHVMPELKEDAAKRVSALLFDKA